MPFDGEYQLLHKIIMHIFVLALIVSNINFKNMKLKICQDHGGEKLDLCRSICKCSNVFTALIRPHLEYGVANCLVPIQNKR